MKSLALVCVLVVSALAQSNDAKSVQVTPVVAESWLDHLHRTFEETSMGKTGRLGPPLSAHGEESRDWQPQLGGDSAKQTVALHGSDLYRLNCRGCHGEFGLGAPPEINSVINPTRATSAQLVIERMKNVGMDMSRADAAELANQSKAALLQRLHKGGTDMPPFPYLSEPEVRAILAYLKQLAGVPGAEKQQATVQESNVRVGEHIVKSTCHICHTAAGPNPGPEQIFNGMIPPLSTLTARTSLPRFERKIRSGAPIMMGTPASLFRGRMPVFYYLSEEEVADAYLYLKLYPPVPTAPDPIAPATEQKQAAIRTAPVELSANPATPPPPNGARDLPMIAFPIAAETFVGLLLAGGFWFTLREIRRLKALSAARRALVLVDGSVAQQTALSKARVERPIRMHSGSEDKNDAGESPRQGEPAFPHDEYLTFESSWLTRWFQGEDEAA